MNQASTDAFHLAMLVNVALLLAGAGVNAVGLRSGVPAESSAEAESGSKSEAKGAESAS